MRSLALLLSPAFVLVSGSPAGAATITTTFEIQNAFGSGGLFNGTGTIVYETQAGAGTYSNRITGLSFVFPDAGGFLSSVTVLSDSLQVTNAGVGPFPCSSDCYEWTVVTDTQEIDVGTTRFRLRPIFLSASSNADQIPTADLTGTFFEDFMFSSSHHRILFEFDLVSGPSFLLRFTGDVINPVSTPSAVPEPAAGLLLSLGLLGLGVRRRLH